MRVLTSAISVCLLLVSTHASAEDGYELWLRYHRVADAALLKQYRSAITGIVVAGESATARATSAELMRGLNGLLDTTIAATSDVKTQRSS